MLEQSFRFSRKGSAGEMNGADEGIVQYAEQKLRPSQFSQSGGQGQTDRGEPPPAGSVCAAVSLRLSSNSLCGRDGLELPTFLPVAPRPGTVGVRFDTCMCAPGQHAPSRAISERLRVFPHSLLWAGGLDCLSLSI